jgi:spermidine synthase
VSPAHALVAAAGAAILALELLAGRFMTPAFGQSLYVWGAVLAVTLAGLALGYRWGGALADRGGDPGARLARHAALAAGWILLIPPLGAPLLRLGIALGPRLGPIAVAIGLFAVPLPLLATATPLGCGALGAGTAARPTTAMARLYALSTIGSIVGALATAYVLLPWLGLARGFLATGVGLLVAAAPWLLRGRARGAALLALALAVGARLLPAGWRGAPGFTDGVVVLARVDGPHGHLVVLRDAADASRVLVVDGVVQTAVSGPELIRGLRYVPLLLREARRFHPAPGRALLIGLGAGAAARGLAAAGWRVDAIELDAAVVALARRWFRLAPADATVHVGDGRAVARALGDAGARFDLVVVDAAAAATQPEHLYNRDAFAELAGLLAPGGVLAVHVLASLDPPRRVVEHVAASLRAVRPVVEARAVTAPRAVGNVVLIAAERAAPPAAPGPGGGHRLPLAADAAPLTDDWNPIGRWSIDADRALRADVRAWLGDAVQLPW